MKVPGFKPMIEDQIEVEIVSSLHPAHIEAQLFKTRTVLDRKNQNARRFQTNGCCLHDISNEMPWSPWYINNDFLITSWYVILLFSAISCIFGGILVCMFLSHFDQIHLSHEKNPPTFHYTGCLIGISRIGLLQSPYNWVGSHPPYTLNNQGRRASTWPAKCPNRWSNPGPTNTMWNMIGIVEESYFPLWILYRYIYIFI